MTSDELIALMRCIKANPTYLTQGKAEHRVAHVYPPVFLLGRSAASVHLF